MSLNKTVTVICNQEERMVAARTFADRHKLAYSVTNDLETGLYFDMTAENPVLGNADNHVEIEVDFTSGALAHRLQFGGGKGQTIAKALGITSKNHPHILDATAGLGRDALVLANLGCRMTLVEQSPLLAEMLSCAVQTASDHPLFNKATKSGFEIFNANAVDFMQQRVIPEADVVYLDPMYPESKKSALVKKDMQLLQQLLGHSTDNELIELLKQGLKFATQRVVVKRPKSAPFLADIEPTLSLNSKKTRYDIYVTKNFVGKL